MRIFLTGRPGCGKSTIVQKVIKELNRKKVKIAGILTPEIRKNSREGFEIVDIASGHKRVMAAVGIKSKYKVSKYGVDVSAIDEVLDKFERSLKTSDIIIIDEIGKMEYCSEKFKRLLQKILKSRKPLLATVGKQFAPRFKNWGDVTIVTNENREVLPEKILEKINDIRSR